MVTQFWIIIFCIFIVSLLSILFKVTDAGAKKEVAPNTKDPITKLKSLGWVNLYQRDGKPGYVVTSMPKKTKRAAIRCRAEYTVSTYIDTVEIFVRSSRNES